MDVGLPGQYSTQLGFRVTHVCPSSGFMPNRGHQQIIIILVHIENNLDKALNSELCSCTFNPHSLS